MARDCSLIDPRDVTGESGRSEESWRGALATALERMGCQTEGSARRGGDESEGVLAVTFRASGTVLSEILDLVSELATRPPSRTRLSQLWSVESRPSLQGGILHTLAPHRASATAPLSENELQAARRDSETLAAFLLLRRGTVVEPATRPTARRSTRIPSPRPAEPRSRGYFRGALTTLPPVRAGR